jgi:hypothetical protein
VPQHQGALPAAPAHSNVVTHDIQHITAISVPQHQGALPAAPVHTNVVTHDIQHITAVSVPQHQGALPAAPAHSNVATHDIQHIPAISVPQHQGALPAAPVHSEIQNHDIDPELTIAAELIPVIDHSITTTLKDTYHSTYDLYGYTDNKSTECEEYETNKYNLSDDDEVDKSQNLATKSAIHGSNDQNDLTNVTNIHPAQIKHIVQNTAVSHIVLAELLQPLSHSIFMRMDSLYKPVDIIGVNGGDDDHISTKGIWIKGFKARGTQKSRSEDPGFRNNHSGFTIGLDSDLKEDLLMGIAYSNAYVDTTFYGTTNIFDQNKTNMHIVTLYGDYNITTPFSIRGELKYGKAFITACSKPKYGKTKLIIKNSIRVILFSHQILAL